MEPTWADYLIGFLQRGNGMMGAGIVVAMFLLVWAVTVSRERKK